MWHDDLLRSIRRIREQDNVKKIYEIPEGGLFKCVFFPPHVTEWIEWPGWWVVGGLGCSPARIFLVNEVTTMLPRALQGGRWYIDRFGEDKCKGEKAIVPGVV